MQITPNQRIRHGGEQYEAGQEYDVDPVLGGYFVLNGWADSDDVESPNAVDDNPVDLKVDDAEHSTEAEVQ